MNHREIFDSLVNEPDLNKFLEKLKQLTDSENPKDAYEVLCNCRTYQGTILRDHATEPALKALVEIAINRGFAEEFLKQKSSKGEDCFAATEEHQDPAWTRVLLDCFVSQRINLRSFFTLADGITGTNNLFFAILETQHRPALRYLAEDPNKQKLKVMLEMTQCISFVSKHEEKLDPDFFKDLLARCAELADIRNLLTYKKDNLNCLARCCAVPVSAYEALLEICVENNLLQEMLHMSVDYDHCHFSYIASIAEFHILHSLLKCASNKCPEFGSLLFMRNVNQNVLRHVVSSKTHSAGDRLTLLISFFPSKQIFRSALSQGDHFNGTVLSAADSRTRALLENENCWESCRLWYQLMTTEEASPNNEGEKTDEAAPDNKDEENKKNRNDQNDE